MTHSLTPWTIGSEHGERENGEPIYQDDTAGWPFFVREPQGTEHPLGLGYGGLHIACGVQRIEDARLIAAAPALLTALKGVLECPQAAPWLARMPHPSQPNANLWDALKAAIAKAEGTPC